MREDTISVLIYLLLQYKSFLKGGTEMTREAFIRKWLANPQKQYNEQCRDEMRDDLDIIQNEAYNQAIRDAAENAKAYNTVPRVYSDACVSKESILKLLKK